MSSIPVSWFNLICCLVQSPIFVAPNIPCAVLVKQLEGWLGNRRHCGTGPLGVENGLSQFWCLIIWFGYF